MQKLFNKILVPIDFSSKSKVAAEKAVDIAKQYDCSIHLLHVSSLSPFSAFGMTEGHLSIPFNLIDNKKELEFQLRRIYDRLQTISGNSIAADYTILSGTWDDSIIDFVNKNNFDLVLIGQKGMLMPKRKMAMNPDKIALKTDVPVITLPSNRRLTRLYSIVIPITDFLPIRKLMYGVYIASKFNTTIKLLAIQNPDTEDKVQKYLQKAYDLMRDICNVQVEKEVIDNDNVADAINQFSVANSADLIIVNPVTQTKMPGFFSVLFGNIIQKYSAPPVLTVNPGFKF